MYFKSDLTPDVSSGFLPGRREHVHAIIGGKNDARNTIAWQPFLRSLLSSLMRDLFSSFFFLSLLVKVTQDLSKSPVARAFLSVCGASISSTAKQKERLQGTLAPLSSTSLSIRFLRARLHGTATRCSTPLPCPPNVRFEMRCLPGSFLKWLWGSPGRAKKPPYHGGHLPARRLRCRSPCRYLLTYSRLRSFRSFFLLLSSSSVAPCVFASSQGHAWCQYPSFFSHRIFVLFRPLRVVLTVSFTVTCAGLPRSLRQPWQLQEDGPQTQP